MGHFNRYGIREIKPVSFLGYMSSLLACHERTWAVTTPCRSTRHAWLMKLTELGSACSNSDRTAASRHTHVRASSRKAEMAPQHRLLRRTQRGS